MRRNSDLMLSVLGAIYAFVGSVLGTGVYAAMMVVSYSGMPTAPVDIVVSPVLTVFLTYCWVWFSVPPAVVAGALLGSLVRTDAIGRSKSLALILVTVSGTAIGIIESALAIGLWRCGPIEAHCVPSLAGYVWQAAVFETWRIGVAGIIAGAISWIIGHELLRHRVVLYRG